MRDSREPEKEVAAGEGYYLERGYIYFSKRPATIRTVVGSCVAVCLWDESLSYGGMNHFVHPVTRSKGKATAQYGNVATAALLRVMEEAGCKREDLVAQILGGAFPADLGGENIGQRNVNVARQVLQRKGVRVVSEDVGGHMGRKIIFDTQTGESVVIKVHRIRESDWVAP